MTFKYTPTRRSKKRGTILPGNIRLGNLYEVQKLLRSARAYAKLADAPMLAGRIRAALKSCEGAIRHAELWDIREARQKRDRADRQAARVLKAGATVCYVKPDEDRVETGGPHVPMSQR